MCSLCAAIDAMRWAWPTACQPSIIREKFTRENLCFAKSAKLLPRENFPLYGRNSHHHLGTHLQGVGTHLPQPKSRNSHHRLGTYLPQLRNTNSHHRLGTYLPQLRSTNSHHRLGTYLPQPRSTNSHHCLGTHLPQPRSRIRHHRLGTHLPQPRSRHTHTPTKE